MGNLSTVQLFGVVIGILISITLVLILTILVIRKRRFSKHNRHQELEDVERNEAIQLDELQSKDFRVKAIEKELVSRPTTSKSSDNSRADASGSILYTTTTNMSGTTLGSPNVLIPASKRLSLGFGSLPISPFGSIAIELNSHSRNVPSKGSAGTLSQPPVPVNRCAGNQYLETKIPVPQTALPTLPRSVALRKIGCPFETIEQEMKRPSIAPRSNPSNFDPWSKSTPTTGDNELENASDSPYSPTRDSLPFSIYSDHDDDLGFVNKLSSASRPTKRQSTDSNTLLDSNSPPIILHQPSHSRNNLSSGSLKRAYDSIKVKLSTTRDMSDLQRHHEPENHHRNESGSVRENITDLDRPIESPFSDSQALMSPSTASFTKGTETRNRSRSNSKDESLAPNITDSNFMRSVPTISVHRFRSDSESSMGSISDLYETYMKKSIMKSELSKVDESGLFDPHVRTEYEQIEYERAENKRNGLLSASAAAGGVRKSPPPSLVLDSEDGKMVPKAIESPVSGWRI